METSTQTEQEFSNQQLRHLNLEDESFVKQFWSSFPSLQEEFGTFACFTGYVRGLQSRRTKILGGIVVQGPDRAKNGLLGGTQVGNETRLVVPRM